MPAFLKKLLPHLLVLIGFIIVSLAYFSPVLEGKMLYQSDIAQYIGMSRQQTEFVNQTGEQPYWTDAAFVGMPTYQLGANYPHNYVKELDRSLRFLPRPADYLFLYFIGFYVLLLVLRTDYRLAFLGALAFGFSTYMIIILGVGHNAKAHAIAYMPVVLAGIILCFRNKYLSGFLLLALGMALEISANHFQMTYYLLLLVIVLGIAYLIDAWRKKKLPDYFKALGVMVLAVLLALGTNATNLMATMEYTDFSTRGDSGLTINPDGSEKVADGLDYNYITEYSYGILESFNLFIPGFMGGSNGENIGTDSEVYQELVQMGVPLAQARAFSESAPLYWGDQPFVGAPAYIGAVVIFLAIMALFLVKGRLKWWLVGGAILALVLSWGKNFNLVTQFFIDYVPLYDKFRAVSSIQVIIELCLPVLAIVGLTKLFQGGVESDSRKKHALKWATIVAGGTALGFLLLKGMFSFSGPADGMLLQQLGPGFLRALKEDREALFTSDTIRSLVLVLLCAGVIWLYLKEKLKQNAVVVLIGLLIVFDLVGVDRRYVNNDDFVSARLVNQPWQPTEADRQIAQDTSHYRVMDLTANPFNTGRTSYFHKSIGGYHAAKPGRMQDLINFHISQNNTAVLNMLNAKYLIVQGEEGPQAQINPNALGNAWFVSKVELAKDPNEEILKLGTVNLRTTAVVNDSLQGVVEEVVGKDPIGEPGTIELVQYQPNKLVYQTDAPEDRLAVFSEMYYPHGWKVTIDGQQAAHFPANYLLRAMVIPAGSHSITFEFDPEVVSTGSSIALTSTLIFGLVLIGSGIYGYRRKRKEQD